MPTEAKSVPPDTCKRIHRVARQHLRFHFAMSEDQAYEMATVAQYRLWSGMKRSDDLHLIFADSEPPERGNEYVRRVARNVRADHFRRLGKEQAALEAYGRFYGEAERLNVGERGSLVWYRAPEPSSAVEVERRELLLQLAQTHLTKVRLRRFQSVFCHGWNTAEIARSEGVSETAVRTSLQDSVAILRPVVLQLVTDLDMKPFGR